MNSEMIDSKMFEISELEVDNSDAKCEPIIGIRKIELEERKNEKFVEPTVKESSIDWPDSTTSASTTPSELIEEEEAKIANKVYFPEEFKIAERKESKYIFFDVEPKDAQMDTGMLQRSVVIAFALIGFDDFVASCREGWESIRRSEKVAFNGYEWNIMIDFRPDTCDATNFGIGFFVECTKPDDSSHFWECKVTLRLKIVSIKNDKSFSRMTKATYSPNLHDFGYRKFVTLEKLQSAFHRHYLHNDTLHFEAEIIPEKLNEVIRLPTKKPVKFAGLLNQGATCYMNSILQSLYFTNKLRKAVYEMPISDEPLERNVGLALQELFYDMQHSNSAVSTTGLTQSFGWNRMEIFTQHDVQELCRVLLDRLETQMKPDDGKANAVKQLFQGKMKSFIKCVEVEFESSQVETFYDVQLNVQSKSSDYDRQRDFDLLAAFHEYTEVEILEGDNKYDAGRHGLQRAAKGVRFLSFPPVLHLHLLRYHYSSQYNTNLKIYNRFPFPDRLDLNEFIDPSEKDSEQGNFIYVLHSILVHSGAGNGGHYLAYINTDVHPLKNSRETKWHLFNDDHVSESTAAAAIEGNFGDEDCYSSAYMLAYIREDRIDEILCDVSAEAIPKSLIDRIRLEKAEVQRKLNEHHELMMQTEISVLTEEDLIDDFETGAKGLNLIDDSKDLYDLGRKIRIRKDDKLEDLADKIANKIYDYKSENRSKYRLWQFANSPFTDPSVSSDSFARYRPSILIPRDVNSSYDTVNALTQKDSFVYYLENRAIDEPQCSSDYHLVLFKYFDVEQIQFKFVGSRYLDISRKSPNDLLAECRKMANLPGDTGINFYEEIACNKLRHISMTRPLIYSISDTMDGIILIFENSDTRTSDRNAKKFVEILSDSVDVVAVDYGADIMGASLALGDSENSIKFRIGLDTSMLDVVTKISDDIEFPLENILIFHASASELIPIGSYLTPMQLLTTNLHSFLDAKVASIEARFRRTFTIFYSKLLITIGELDDFKMAKGCMLNADFNSTKMVYFLYRSETIKEVLERCSSTFPFSIDGTKKLRFVELVGTQGNGRCIRVIENEDSANYIFDFCSFTTIRIEEVPHDQLELNEEHEKLISVVRYDVGSRQSSLPSFFIKLDQREPASAFRTRLQDKLGVKTILFDRLRIWIVNIEQSNRSVVEIDFKQEEACRVHLAALFACAKAASPANAPYLQVDLPTENGYSSDDSEEFELLVEKQTPPQHIPVEPSIVIRN